MDVITKLTAVMHFKKPFNDDSTVTVNVSPFNQNEILSGL